MGKRWGKSPRRKKSSWDCKQHKRGEDWFNQKENVLTQKVPEKKPEFYTAKQRKTVWGAQTEKCRARSLRGGRGERSKIALSITREAANLGKTRGGPTFGAKNNKLTTKKKKGNEENYYGGKRYNAIDPRDVQERRGEHTS